MALLPLRNWCGVSARVRIWTDGCVLKNPGGAGGWAFVARIPGVGVPATSSGGVLESTNNKMELQAIIEALRFAEKSLKSHVEVILYTDSQYCSRGVNEWLEGWKAKGWHRKDGERWVDVKNRSLWEMIDELFDSSRMKIDWVRGHSGIPENERADELASLAASAEQTLSPDGDPAEQFDERFGTRPNFCPNCGHSLT